MKEKEIAKMVRDMLSSPFGCVSAISCDRCYEVKKLCSNYKFAKNLYNAGYRQVGDKIDINEVRKATVKEVLKRVKEQSMWFIENSMQENYFNEELRDIAQENGVEIEEGDREND